MNIQSIIGVVVGFAAAIFAAWGFYKAGSFKAKTPIDKLIEAGFGWVKGTPAGAVRLLAWLEILGAIGVVVAPAAVLLGLAWAKWFAVAAAAGLALVQVSAIILHQVRGESKYTLKMNLGLLAPALVALAAWVIFL
jgi:hypothetical protein